ncbi:hypothetical protein [Cysteiniphilum litorale]|uniref:hypothetical protein n=1 Tax=Cysteiniphilum litorale TaxID=2056700 RepID=UPI003F8831C8
MLVSVSSYSGVIHNSINNNIVFYSNGADCTEDEYTIAPEETYTVTVDNNICLKIYDTYVRDWDVKDNTYISCHASRLRVVSYVGEELSDFLGYDEPNCNTVQDEVAKKMNVENQRIKFMK